MLYKIAIIGKGNVGTALAEGTTQPLLADDSS